MRDRLLQARADHAAELTGQQQDCGGCWWLEASAPFNAPKPGVANLAECVPVEA